MRINIGCGQTPTLGWRNFDNSLSIRLARVPLLAELLLRLRLIAPAQYRFVRYARTNGIESGDAVKGLHVPTGSCEVVYSSHMVEHLDRLEADRFLAEAFRVLQPGGWIRIATPDLGSKVARYLASGAADELLQSTQLCVPRPRRLADRLRLLVVGTRHHQWLYDGVSLCRLLERHGFVEATTVLAGETRIPEPGALDLRERAAASVYVEARKPLTSECSEG